MELVALTGTPGTGKSSAAAQLKGRLASIELSELALTSASGTGSRRTVEVDVPALSRWVRPLMGPAGPPLLIVGHLAQFLPVARAIVLRAHPLEVARRLRRSARGTVGERWENAAAEAIGLVRAETAAAGVPLLEIDTTRLRPPRVADAIARTVKTGFPRSTGRPVDWLADPSVTAELLRRLP